MTPDIHQVSSTKSIAQRALDAQYDAGRLAECLNAAYWLASCHEEQADYMAGNRMKDAEERLLAVATALGYRVERVVSGTAAERMMEERV